jgi:hypothetical protein
MAGKITDYPTMTTLASGDLMDVSDYDGVSAFTSKSLDWDDLKTNIEGQITFANIYSNNGTLAGNRIVTLNGNDLTFAGTVDANLLRLDPTTDFIGIGTILPTEKLEVVGAAKIAGANDTQIGGVTASGRMKIVGGLSYMLIQNANLSGIANHAMTQDGNGSTTLNGSSGRVLSLRLNQIPHLDITANLIQNIKSTEFLNYVRVTGDGAAMALGQTTDINTAFLVKSNRTTILDIGSVSTTFLSMNSSGNVGIGTATPTETLEVVGNTFVNTGKLTVSNAFNTSTGAIEATAQATSGSSGFTSAGKFNSLITTAGFWIFGKQCWSFSYSSWWNI